MLGFPSPVSEVRCRMGGGWVYMIHNRDVQLRLTAVRSL